MKNTIIILLLVLGLTACNASVSSSNESESNSEAAASPESEVEKAPAKSDIVVNVPERGADWVDHKLAVNNAHLLLSAPKSVKVQDDEYGIYVNLDENHSMKIDFEPLNVREEKEWYMGKKNRKDLVWLIDTETEALYTGQDLSAPEGHQTTNSFFASKKIGNKDYSTNFDGITVDGDQVYNASPEDCQLLLGIFRTLREQ